MIRGDDQGVVGILDEGLRDRAESVVARRELVHPTLFAELVDRGADVAARQVFDGLFERRVLLSHDGVQANGLDAGLLQLVIRSARLDRMMLTRVPDQENAIR